MHHVDPREIDGWLRIAQRIAAVAGKAWKNGQLRATLARLQPALPPYRLLPRSITRTLTAIEMFSAYTLAVLILLVGLYVALAPYAMTRKPLALVAGFAVAMIYTWFAAHLRAAGDRALLKGSRGQDAGPSQPSRERPVATCLPLGRRWRPRVRFVDYY
jgi:hypothetical protein